MKKNLLGAVSAIALGTVFTMGLAQSASAASYNPVVTGSPITFSKSNESGTISVAGFNASFGTLTSVTIAYAGTEDLFATASNAGNASSQAIVALQATGTLTLSTASPTPFSITSSLSTAPVNYTIAAGAVNNAITSSGSTSVSGTQTVSSNLSQYIGSSSTYLVSLVNTAGQSSTSGCNSPPYCGTIVTGTVGITVTYNYSVPTVPEPASLALLGAGVVGIGAIRRRRRG